MFHTDVIEMEARAGKSWPHDLPSVEEYTAPFIKQNRALMAMSGFIGAINLFVAAVTSHGGAVGNVLVVAMMLWLVASRWSERRTIKGVSSCTITFYKDSYEPVSYKRAGLERLTYKGTTEIDQFVVYDGFLTPAGDLLATRVTPLNWLEMINPARHGHLSGLAILSRYAKYKHAAHTRWAESIGATNGTNP